MKTLNMKMSIVVSLWDLSFLQLGTWNLCCKEYTGSDDQIAVTIYNVKQFTNMSYLIYSFVVEKRSWSLKKQSQRNMAFRAANLIGLSLLLIFAPCRSLTKQISQQFDIAEEDSTVEKRSLTKRVRLSTTK